jgi:hypothetical protein
MPQWSSEREMSAEYVPRGVLRTPSRLENAAAIVRSSSRFEVGRASMKPPSFSATVSGRSLWRMPAALFTTSVSGQ